MAEYRLSPAEARLLTKAAIVPNFEYGPADAQARAAAAHFQRSE